MKPLDGVTVITLEHAIAAPFATAGATWWIENRWVLPEGTTDPMAVVRERLTAGPPAVAGG